MRVILYIVEEVAEFDCSGGRLLVELDGLLQGLPGFTQVMLGIFATDPARPKDLEVRIPGPGLEHGLDFGQRHVITLLFPRPRNRRELLLEREKIAHDLRPFPFSRSRSVCSICFLI